MADFGMGEWYNIDPKMTEGWASPLPSDTIENQVDCAYDKGVNGLMEPHPSAANLLDQRLVAKISKKLSKRPSADNLVDIGILKSQETYSAGKEARVKLATELEQELSKARRFQPAPIRDENGNDVWPELAPIPSILRGGVPPPMFSPFENVLEFCSQRMQHA